MRQESRGAHTRFDYAGERDEWVQVNLVSKRGKDGKMEIRKEPRPAPAKELSDIAYATLEDLEGKNNG